MRDDCPLNQPMNCPDCGGYNMDCDKHDSNGEINNHREPCLWCVNLLLEDKVKAQAFRIRKLEKWIENHNDTSAADDAWDDMGDAMMSHYPGDSQ